MIEITVRHLMIFHVYIRVIIATIISKKILGGKIK